MANVLRQKDPEKYHRCVIMIEKGGTIRELMEAEHIAKNTAMRLRHIVYDAMDTLMFELPVCACGKPAGHNGWCKERFATHPKRQAVIAKMTLAQKLGIDPVRI